MPSRKSPIVRALAHSGIQLALLGCDRVAQDGSVKPERSVWFLCTWLSACGSPAAPQSSTATPTPTPEPIVEDRPESDDAGSTPEERPEPSCPAPEHAPHCLWMATNPPNPNRAKHVAKRMSADGYAAVADGDRIVVHLDDEHLGRLFGGEIGHEPHAASSDHRMRCVAAIPAGRKLDARYRGEVGEVMLDDPACEL